MHERSENIEMSDEIRQTICFLTAPFKIFVNSRTTLTCQHQSALYFETVYAKDRRSSQARLQTGGTLEGSAHTRSTWLSRCCLLYQSQPGWHMCMDMQTAEMKARQIFTENDATCLLESYFISKRKTDAAIRPNVSVARLTSKT